MHTIFIQVQMIQLMIWISPSSSLTDILYDALGDLSFEDDDIVIDCEE